MNYQKSILKYIESYTVMRASDLSLQVMSEINPLKFENEDYLDALQNLIEKGEIKQFMYTVSSGTKVLYFPGEVRFLIGK